MRCLFCLVLLSLGYRAQWRAACALGHRYVRRRTKKGQMAGVRTGAHAIKQIARRAFQRACKHCLYIKQHLVTV